MIFLVTFVEIAYIYQFSYVLRLINDDQFLIVDLLSWIMVLQVSISQFFVWSAILFNEENLCSIATSSDLSPSSIKGHTQ